MSDSTTKGSRRKQQNDQKRSLRKSKTLLDIIVDEESGATPYKDLIDRYSTTKHHRKSSIKDWLRLRRSSSASSAKLSSSSSSFSASSSSHAEDKDIQEPRQGEGEKENDGGNEDVEGRPPQPPLRTKSLMALLEETDRQAGIVGAKYLEDEEEEEEEEEETPPPPPPTVKEKEGGEEEDGAAGDGAVDGEGKFMCCVCMVRHKGAAFIPCGHTFCRICSRELWVNRRNCPLCNRSILEILDIF